jgi:hypothetical protein
MEDAVSNQPGVRKSTDAEKALFLDGKSVTVLFPLNYPSGYTILEMSFYCFLCKQQLKDEHVRGKITFPTEHLALVEVAGLCMECELLTNFYYRIRDNGVMDGPVGAPDGGPSTWQRWEFNTSDTPDWIIALRQWLKRLAFNLKAALLMPLISVPTGLLFLLLLWEAALHLKPH